MRCWKSCDRRRSRTEPAVELAAAEAQQRDIARQPPLDAARRQALIAARSRELANADGRFSCILNPAALLISAEAQSAGGSASGWHGLQCDMDAGRVLGRQDVETANTMRPIDRFLSLVGADLSAAATAYPRSPESRVAALLEEAPTPAETLPPQRLGVCRHLGDACAEMRPDLAAAFKALEPALAWRARIMPNASSGFADGHASARVLDHTGLERRGGLVSGFSLVAPGITYPEHNHPPEEIYLVLSPGEWWQAGVGWRAYGPGGIVHNPPNIQHAMRAANVPLLAIWFLLPG